MSATLFATELTNLATEAKRKNPELKAAAEKSLTDLKGLTVTSEQQLAADLSRRTSFIDPFLIACGTHNAKFAGSGVTCLQRLVIAKGLPTSRLQDALDALNDCTNLGLDIQVKILQALPSLLQNYADDLKGDLLSTALQVCSSLQGAKVQTVSGVASATLQQLVAAVFERVIDEDKRAGTIAAIYEVPGADEPLHLRPAAYDAYRIFRDFVLAADSRKTKFVQFSSLTRESSLELIWSCINAQPGLITSHTELGSIVQANILPLITQALSEKLSMPLTLRSLRLLDMILSRYIKNFPAECEVVLGLAINALDPDSVPLWKRALVMEMLRNFFADGGHISDAYSLLDMRDDGKPVIQDIMATFVRMSAEKPSLIGLGQQSSVPVGPANTRDQADQDISVEAAGSMAVVISSALGVAEANVAGISAQWSLPRTPCLEQLDKADPPSVPETYVYALVLECLNGLSDSLAMAIIPITVHHEKPKSTKPEVQSSETTYEQLNPQSQLSSRRIIPVNPLELENHASISRVKAVAGLIESCWPAVLATASTFLNAALDDQYYRNLIKSYQRFAQVAGLLRLSTARDALMTTLGKVVVPPHVLNNLIVDTPKTPALESPRSFSNSITLLSVDSIVNSSSSDRDRRGPGEGLKPMLSTRNLLCLRALLNLAIALGPAMDTAFAVVIETLRQADMVLSSTSPQQMIRQGVNMSARQIDSPTVAQSFSNEVSAVEAAASRLLESSADYPNESFLNVLKTFCSLLHVKTSSLSASRPSSPATSPGPKSRSFSGYINTNTELQLRDYKFAIPKLGHLASQNVSRFISEDPAQSGWNIIIDELVTIASNNGIQREARRAATDVLCKVAAETVSDAMEEQIDLRGTVQRRALAVLLRTIDSIYAKDGELTGGDIEVQGHVVESLRTILERCGDSLVAGWNRAVAILSSVFERNGTPPRRQDNEEALIDWQHISKDLVSVPLGRSAFAATQLICSDFLSSVPATVMPALIELFHRFASQKDDLNISLTTITMAWNVSDYLLSSISSDELHNMSKQVKEADDVMEEVEANVRTSGPAQWLLLLLRIQDIVRTAQIEVRKAAFQTLCSIFKNHGNLLTSAAWDLTLGNIVFRIAANDSLNYFTDDGDRPRVKDSTDETISSAIISGISEVIAQHLRLIEDVSPLASLWEAFLSRLEAYLDVQHLNLTTAVYQAISRVVSRIESTSQKWSGPMYRTLHLWLKREPSETIVASVLTSNQEAFIAYVEAGAELYRLTQQNMSIPQTRALVENLYLVVRHSNGPKYGADISNLSQLQDKVLDFIKFVKSDAPSTLVIVAAKFVTLHHDTAAEISNNTRPTFIALSSACIDWLQELVLQNVNDNELLDSGSFCSAVQSLRQLIEMKYLFNLEHKGTSLWRKATKVALALSKPLLHRYSQPDIEEDSATSMWTEYARIVNGVVSARGLDAVKGTPKVFEDEAADIESFKQLREVVVPGLGKAQLASAARDIFAHALFDASIVHPTQVGEIPIFPDGPLERLQQIRRGRVKKAACVEREAMSYVCLSELVALASTNGDSPSRNSLAQAIAPFLVLRLAIPIRAYVADQPLRGRQPQPLSELEELLKCLKIIRQFRCDPDALTPSSSGPRWPGEQAHLQYLHPLLVKALAVAGDRRSGSDEVLIPLQAVIEAMVKTS